MNSLTNPVARHFAEMPDPRRPSHAQKHELLDILTIALCAMLSGAETFVDMERFGQAKAPWLQAHLGLRLPSGIPSHDTFARLFARLEPGAFGHCMQAWTQTLHAMTGGQVIAIDGKCLRRSFDSASGHAALQMVSAWASAARLVLAQTAVDQKSNEITAVPALLEMLAREGSIVTVDALNSHKRLARQASGPPHYRQKGRLCVCPQGESRPVARGSARLLRLVPRPTRRLGAPE